MHEIQRFFSLQLITKAAEGFPINILPVITTYSSNYFSELTGKCNILQKKKNTFTYKR